MMDQNSPKNMSFLRLKVHQSWKDNDIGTWSQLIFINGFYTHRVKIISFPGIQAKVFAQRRYQTSLNCIISPPRLLRKEKDCHHKQIDLFSVAETKEMIHILG